MGGGVVVERDSWDWAREDGMPDTEETEEK